MQIQVISTDRAPEAIGPYSQGIVCGNQLFVSGQLGLSPETGELVSGALDAQARQALENLRQILLAGRASLEDVVAVDVFVTDIGKFGQFNAVYAEFFGDHRPARAVVEVSALPKDALVEIKCIAVFSG